MSHGNKVEPEHGVTFLEALRKVTQMKQWSVGEDARHGGSKPARPRLAKQQDPLAPEEPEVALASQSTPSRARSRPPAPARRPARGAGSRRSRRDGGWRNVQATATAPGGGSYGAPTRAAARPARGGGTAAAPGSARRLRQSSSGRRRRRARRVIVPADETRSASGNRRSRRCRVAGRRAGSPSSTSRSSSEYGGCSVSIGAIAARRGALLDAEVRDADVTHQPCSFSSANAASASSRCSSGSASGSGRGRSRRAEPREARLDSRQDRVPREVVRTLLSPPSSRPALVNTYGRGSRPSSARPTTSSEWPSP